MQNDALERMKKLLDQFDALERRVSELQDRTAGILRDFEQAVQPLDIESTAPAEESIAVGHAAPKFESAWRI